MKKTRHYLFVMFVSAAWLLTSVANAEDNKRVFAVTVTNLTQGEVFTPIMVASHRAGIRVFQLGEAASSELEILAESGDTQPLTAALTARGALDVVTADGPLPPGQSVTLLVKRNGRNNHISVASMLVPSNDAFFALNGIRGPRNNRGLTRLVPAYDAGTESNDELCQHIPGPPTVCTGEGFNPASGEGYVYVHPGIHGGADLSAAAYDWRNPVARIRVRALNK